MNTATAHTIRTSTGYVSESAIRNAEDALAAYESASKAARALDVEATRLQVTPGVFASVRVAARKAATGAFSNLGKTWQDMCSVLACAGIRPISNTTVDDIANAIHSLRK